MNYLNINEDDGDKSHGTRVLTTNLYITIYECRIFFSYSKPASKLKWQCE